MKPYAVLAGFALATAAAVPAPAIAQVGYALYTQWDDTSLSLVECKRHGEIALRDSGFRNDLTVTSNSVLARHSGGYTAAVRCVESKHMVFFVVSGPKGSLTQDYISRIAKNY
jgi:hypothetical protein